MPIFEETCSRKLGHVAELWKFELEIILSVQRALAGLTAIVQAVRAANTIAANPRKSFPILLKLNLKTLDLGSEEAIFMVASL